jgi:hypothetical protein
MCKLLKEHVENVKRLEELFAWRNIVGLGLRLGLGLGLNA